ncbi:MAG: hypothetical protein IJQ34_09115 [Kiritimatiellae bacterium]|nr:hypothetical protein [Kiritimatiellia bacterium]
MQLSEALELLHVDAGLVDNEVEKLIAGLAPYIEKATGLSEEEQAIMPLCRIAEKFLLLKWYYGGAESDRVLNSVLSQICTTARL